jgi:hypothetical protein
MIFPEICKKRRLLAWDVILPEEEVPQIWPGLVKLTVLNALKASTRDYSDNRSVSTTLRSGRDGDCPISSKGRMIGDLALSARRLRFSE